MMPPVHRWLTFSDSWSPASVEFLLDTVKPTISSIIYDPFVGCGTTPVVCAEQGIRTVSCDISSLAIAATSIKLEPPSEQELDRLQILMNESGPEQLLASFANKTLSKYVSGSLAQLLKFVLAAVLLRVDWHKGAALEMDNVTTETAKLMSEMRADIAVVSTPPQLHRIYCSEFLALDAREIISFAHGTVMMISSPPFFGSNFNPAKQRLASLLGEPIMNRSAVRRNPTWTVPEALSILESFRGAEAQYNQVADYLFFLDSIVAHAVDIGCRSVALEMGPKNIEGQEVRFDLFLAQRLVASNYRIDLFEMTETEPEICTFICAHACGL
jgi:hypothetical protein